MGTLAILNVAAGDTKLTFDKNNPAESIRAGRIVTDMLRRGYALLVEVERNGEKRFERARSFDEQTSEYIIADFNALEGRDSDLHEVAIHLRKDQEQANGQSSANEENNAPIPDGEGGKVPNETPKRGRPRGGSRRIPADKANAVGVARSAGG